MADHARGQVDTGAAEVYESLFVPALFGRFVDVVVDATALSGDESILDVACGTGALARAARPRTTGRVVGVDVNPGMLAVAQRHSTDIEYVEGDALSLPFDAGIFDVAASQFGLMFYPDPAQGLREMSRVARRGTVAIWDSIERSAGYSELQELFRDELGDEAATSLDAPFAMGTPGVLENVFATAGIEGVAYESVSGSGRFASIDEWVTTEVRGWTLGDAVSDEQLEDLVSVARTRLARFATPDGCEFGIAAKLAIWSA